MRNKNWINAPVQKPELFPEYYEKSLIADYPGGNYIGSVPLCIALQCCGIGTAKVNGKKVYISWGRNLTRDEQEHFAAETHFQPVWLGADRGTCELILPDAQAEAMLLLITT